MSEQEIGWKIGGTVYAVPSRFRRGDAILIREVTRLSWAEFTQLLAEEEPDPSVEAGLLAVAVWQTNPGWKMERVVRFVEELWTDDGEFVDGGEASPPAESPSSSDEPHSDPALGSSDSSDATTNGSPDVPLTPETLPPTGLPG